MKLTATMLKKIVKEEMSKLGEAAKAKNDSDIGGEKAKEVEAGDEAEQLSKKFEYAKALGLEEARLQRRLKRVQEARRRALKQLSSL